MCDSATHWHNPRYKIELPPCGWTQKTVQYMKPSHRYTQSEQWGEQQEPLISMNLNTEGQCETMKRLLTLSPALPCIYTQQEADTDINKLDGTHRIPKVSNWAATQRKPEWRKQGEEGDKEPGDGGSEGGCTLIPSTGLWMTVVWGSWRKNEEKGWKKKRECFLTKWGFGRCRVFKSNFCGTHS